MLRLTEIALPIDHTADELTAAIADRLAISTKLLKAIHIRRKSLDARKRHRLLFVYTIDAEIIADQKPVSKQIKRVSKAPSMQYCPPKVNNIPSSNPVVIGAGPAGLFTSLILAQAGFNPILLERGKPAIERDKDVAEYWNSGNLDTESNVQFGEGGAGTFSDGKLTTQIKDRNNRCIKVLQELVEAGAPEEVIYLAKPHIGTDILVKVVTNLRKKIISLGGQVRFRSCVKEIMISDERANGVKLQTGEEIQTDNIVLAIGHSARDTFKMLYEKGVSCQQKAFSVGARIEHHQSMIDKVQYGKFADRHEIGPAEYKLAHHCPDGRGVYTFCMCPGGQVIGAASEQGMIATNGMSVYKRNSQNANSALLVSVLPSDFQSDHPLAGIEFQRKIESDAFIIAGSNGNAPAQRVEDFLLNRPTESFGIIKPSYTPQVTMCQIDKCLPTFVADAMRLAIVKMDKKLQGFALSDAVLTAPETRSSSPVRLLRDKTFQSVNIANLYPTGEGAGYAGGIISAAVDGIKVAEEIIKKS